MKRSMKMLFGFSISCILVAGYFTNLSIAQTGTQNRKGSDAQSSNETDDKKTSTDEVETSLPKHLRTGVPKSLGDVKLLEQHVQKVLDKVRPATVSVAGGSGVVVSKDGLILTVAHVNQQPRRRVYVYFPDGKKVVAETLGSNHGRIDAGMMRIIDKGEYPYVEMGESKSLVQGQWCIAVGFPVSFNRGQQPPARLGRLLRKSEGALTTDCTIMGGDSGGPLFDFDGKVIGIHSRVNSRLDRNIHVPIDIYTSSWERFLAGEEWGQIPRSSAGSGAYLGVQRKENEWRAIVGLVVKDSAAEKAGIKAGDVIIEFEGVKIGTFEQLVQEVKKVRRRQRVDIKLLRDGKQMTFENIRLGTRPDFNN